MYALSLCRGFIVLHVLQSADKRAWGNAVRVGGVGGDITFFNFNSLYFCPEPHIAYALIL